MSHNDAPKTGDLRAELGKRYLFPQIFEMMHVPARSASSRLGIRGLRSVKCTAIVIR